MTKTSNWARYFLAKTLKCKANWHDIVCRVVNLVEWIEREDYE